MRVVVLGGTGQLGSAVVSRLSADPRFDIRAFTSTQRTAPIAGMSPLDIEQASSVHAALKHSDVVVHAASYTGEDPETQQRVNVDGTRNVTTACEALHIRLVYISTAGVYGTLPWSGGAESDYALAPESPLSKSRLHAERIVHAVDGIVLRPLFSFGSGDRRFLLPLSAGIIRLGAWVDDGAALLSAGSFEYFGETMVQVLDLIDHDELRTPLHIVPRHPIAVRSLVEPILSGLGLTITQSITADEARERAERIGVDVRKIGQFTSDYFLSGERLHRLIPESGVYQPALRNAHLPWYTQQLARMTSS